MTPSDRRSAATQRLSSVSGPSAGGSGLAIPCALEGGAATSAIASTINQNSVAVNSHPSKSSKFDSPPHPSTRLAR